MTAVANPYPYHTAKFVFVDEGKNEIQQIRRRKINTVHVEYIHRVVVHQKCPTWLGEMIILSPRLDNYQFSQ